MAKFITKESKSGKGVSKDAPEKRRFFLFFELFGSKIKNLIKLNLIYFITLIPLIAGLYFSLTLNPEIHTHADIYKYPILILTPDILSISILAVSIFITGPATAGFVFVLRNLQRREHSWILSDFFEQFKKNFWQASAMCAIDIICYMLLYVAFGFYIFIMPSQAPGIGETMGLISAIFVCALTLVFTWAHFYIYTMMVTFKLDFGKLFKNSLVFAIAKLPLNILITVIEAAIIFICLYICLYIPVITAVLIMFILLSFMGFIAVFSTYPTIDKFMLQRVNTSGRVLNTRNE